MTALELAKLFDEVLWCLDAFDDIMDMELGPEPELDPLSHDYIKMIALCRNRVSGALAVAMKAAEREVT